ncbi:MAG TPA: DUF2075 domain-containing protein [Tepidisphaeraceae bacterium]|nr:DUF2075 domain-containing protein [Tepidisphaeraceae bacterium]
MVEFKTGAESHTAVDVWQVQSYALDLRDFHPGCRGKTIIPILVATDAPTNEASERLIETQLRGASFAVQQVNAAGLGPCLRRFSASASTAGSDGVDADSWESARYSPTPTIIEAAQKLFGGHQVREISHAFSDTLDRTSKVISDAISRSRSEGIRTICFVTGIPGSGKTLVGLNAAHSPELLHESQTSAIFLSGNGPLVKVIREALCREQAARGVRKSEAIGVASSFIANVHGFIKAFGITHPDSAPDHHAIIFDEAQRAWSKEAVAKEHEIERSEPALVLDIMERVPGWAAIVALVGGGQEINTGEAGLAEWGRALANRDQNWCILASPDVLSGAESVAGHRLFPDGTPPNLRVVPIPDLHLRVNVRSHRAQFMGSWVNQLLLDGPSRTVTTEQFGNEFPIVFTRSLARAKEWLRERQEGRQRTGLLASSGAIRLRAYGLELSSAFRKGVSYPDWFLNPPGDVRSSFQLEIAATEFDSQGLEIDWAGVCWGGDFVVDPETKRWACFQFKGNRWIVPNGSTREYIRNKYRVLLTRARRGMIVWIPSGPDAARDPASFDAVTLRLARAGMEQLD